MRPSRARQRVRSAFRRVDQAAFVESAQGSVGLAACELVAAAAGYPYRTQPEDQIACVFALCQSGVDDLRLEARSALGRIAGDGSELALLWRDSAAVEEWRQYLGGLADRLGAQPRSLDPPPKPKRRRRLRLGDVYEVRDADLGYGYFQHVGNTKLGRVVLVLEGWYRERQNIERLQPSFEQWTEVGYLVGTWLPPTQEHLVLGTLRIAQEASQTFWRRVQVLKSVNNPAGWFITRDYSDDEPWRAPLTGVEFALLHPEINQSKLALSSIGSVVWQMKNAGPGAVSGRS